MNLELAASWLSAEVLLLVVPVRSEAALDLLVSGEDAIELETDRVDTEAGAVILVRFVPPPSRRGSLRLSVRTSAGESALDLGRPIAELSSLCRQGLAALDAAARARVLKLLTGALRWEQSDGDRLHHSLGIAREALRERLPLYQAAAGGPTRLSVNAIVRADATTFLVTGVVADADAVLASLTAVAPEGSRAEILPRLCRHPHRREKAAFTTSFTLDVPSVLDDGWRLELREATGDGLEVAAPRVISDLAEARRVMLASLESDAAPVDALMTGHLCHGLFLLQRRLRGAPVVERVDQYGLEIEQADISVVIVMGRRADLVEHQLAQFVLDPEMARADLVFVDVNGKLSGDQGSEQAAQLHDLYRLPFRIATLSRDPGYAAAIDAGAALARAPMLVIMAADALPAEPHWLSRLAAYHRTTETGVAMPRVLAADGTARDAASPDAMSCLMVERDLLKAMGGFSGRYVRGDFEGVDLSQRLRHQGKQVGCCPDAAVYLLREPPTFDAPGIVETRHDEWMRAHRDASPD